MKTIDETQLESDLAYRFRYLADFVGFDASDAAAVQASGPFLGPLIPQLVDKTYEKLLAYDAPRDISCRVNRDSTASPRQT